MSPYQILFTRQAKKDVESLSPKLKQKLRDILINLIAQDPFSGKKLWAELAGNYSYRLSLKDRIVYSIDTKKKIVYIKRTRTHYGD